MCDLFDAGWRTVGSATRVFFEFLTNRFSICVAAQTRIEVLRYPTDVLIRKFPGPLSHLLADWPGFFFLGGTPAPGVAGDAGVHL